MGVQGYGGMNGKGAIFCPECGKRIPAASIYCEYCGERVWKEGADYAVNGGSVSEAQFIRARRMLYGVVVALAILAVYAFFLPRENWDVESKSVFYVKDNAAYGYRAKGQEEKAEELTLQYFEKWNNRPSGGMLQGRADNGDGMREPGTDPAYSASGRYFYGTELGTKDSFNLIRTDLKEKETKTMDSGVVEFLPAGSAKVVYRKENGTLYYYDGSRKNKIASSVEFYCVNKTGSRLLWITKEDGVSDIYCLALSKKAQPVRLERNAVLLDASPSLGTILVQKEDTVFKISSEGKKERLAGEISAVMQGDAVSGSFYFLKEGDGEAGTDRELYYFGGGEARLIEDSFSELVWQGGGVVLYRRTEDEGGCMMASGGKTGELGREIDLPGQIRAEGERLYFLSTENTPGENGKPKHELCFVLLSESEFQVKVVDRGVSEIAGVYGGSVYYFKEMGSSVGDLYLDGEWAAYDVAVGSVAGLPGGGALCIADASSSGKRGTLTLLDGENGKNIADNVRAYSAVSGDEVYILSDYSREKRRGNLLLFDGKKTELLESDIWGYYQTGNSGICR